MLVVGGDNGSQAIALSFGVFSLYSKIQHQLEILVDPSAYKMIWIDNQRHRYPESRTPVGRTSVDAFVASEHWRNREQSDRIWLRIRSNVNLPRGMYLLIPGLIQRVTVVLQREGVCYGNGLKVCPKGEGIINIGGPWLVNLSLSHRLILGFLNGGLSVQ